MLLLLELPFALFRAGKDKSSAEPESPESLMHPPSSESSDCEMQGGEDAVEDEDEPPYDDDISLRLFLSIGQLVLQLFSPLATVVIIVFGKGDELCIVLVATAVVVVLAVIFPLLLLLLLLLFISLGKGDDDGQYATGTGESRLGVGGGEGLFPSIIGVGGGEGLFDSLQLV